MLERLLPAHSNVTTFSDSCIARSSLKLNSSGRSTSPSTTRRQVEMSIFGTGKWLRTKKRSVGVIQALSDASGGSAQYGDSLATLRPEISDSSPVGTAWGSSGRV